MKIKQLTLRFFFMFFGLLPLFVSAQENDLSINKGRLWVENGSDISFLSLTKSGDKITIKRTGGHTETLSNNEVIQIDQQTGTKALLLAGVMGGSALLGSLLGIAQAEASSGIEAETSSKTGIVLGLTAAGALVGALIGANKKKYKTVYENPKFGLSPDQFKLDIKSQNGIASFTLNYTF